MPASLLLSSTAPWLEESPAPHSGWPKRLVVSNGHELEETLLAEQAAALSIPVVYSSPKRMERGRTPITPDDLVAGGVPFIVQALHQLKRPMPSENSYPEVLAPWLGRWVARRQTLHEVLHEVETRGQPVFVKPAEGWKRFPGFVLETSNDLWRLGYASRRRPVWTAQPIAIVAEYRVYVAHGQLLHIARYDGVHDTSQDTGYDRATIEAAVHAYAQAGAPDGFAIDFCVDAQGRTLLLECNGGFSVGAYGQIAAAHYWAMTAAYWRWWMTHAPVVA